MNKKFSIVAVLAVLAMVGAGCSGTTSDTNVSEDSGSAVESSNGAQGTLDGTWKITTATGDFASLNEGTKYIFAGDSLTTKLGIIETKGSITSKTDSEMTVQFEGMSNPSTFKYRFEGANLILEPGVSGQVFTLEKQ